MFKHKRGIILVLALLFIIVAAGGWFFIGCPPLENCPFFRLKKENPKKVFLTFVGPWDNPEDWREIIAKFKRYKISPENGSLDVYITYEKIKDPINYEDLIRDRQFEDGGPNIFTVFHTWIPKYEDRIAPIPTELMNIAQFKNTFAKAAEEDLTTPDGKIYALPFYVDTLALYYNEDMFFNENIPRPPQTWDEFQNDVEKLAKIENGRIVQSGAAFGGGKNINRSQDIIMLLVMQNNASEKNLISLSSDQSAAAIKFYTDFANPDKRFYTWNANEIYSIDAFTQRKAAMLINYSHHVTNVKDKTGNTLNFKIAPIPQVNNNNKINYANYWVPVVSKKASCKVDKGAAMDCSELAWEFLAFASRKENAKLYLDSAKLPAANLELAEKQATEFSDTRSVFAGQVFTARSWEHPDDAATDKFLIDMIDSIITSTEKDKRLVLMNAINLARKRMKVLN